MSDGDIIVMCSDGIAGKREDRRVRSALEASSGDTKELCREIIESVIRETEADDDMTVIAIRASEE